MLKVLGDLTSPGSSDVHGGLAAHLGMNCANKIGCVCLFIDVQHYKAKTRSPGMEEIRM